MEYYGLAAIEEIARQFSKGINPAVYNGHLYFNN